MAAEAPKKPMILGMGNPLLDISAVVPQSLLDKYDVKLDNAILAEDKHLPIYDELVKEHSPTYIAGGSTQNSIRVCQWMLQKPNSTAFIGCVGKDAFSKQLRASAKSDGIAVHYMEDEKTPTGTCAVLIKDTERSMIANLSAANNYKIDHLKTQAITDVYKSAQFYYIAGFFLTVSPDTMLHVAKHALETKKMFALNLSAPFICEFFMEPMDSVLPYTDIIFGNKNEALAFAKKKGWETTKLEEIAVKIAELPKKGDRKRLVAITDGAHPVVVCVEGKVRKFPCPKVDKIVDANGAGDAFVGGFLAMFLQKKPIDVCVRAGQYASATVLQVSGTILSGKPSFEA